MPEINASARIVGVPPNDDPTPTTAFTWSGQIQFNAQTCGGPPRAINLDIPSETSVGGQFTPTFSAIRGGQLTLKVSAVVNGQTLTKSTSGVVITGTNPPIAAIGAALGNDTLRQIACFESKGMRQFNANAGGGEDPCPVLADDGGIGIMQITRWKEVEANGTCGPTTFEAPPADLFWDWTKNVEAGIEVFNRKLNTAREYPGAVSKRREFKQLAKTSIAYWRQHGYPNLKTIDVPPFEDWEIQLDAIRGYNGWCGRDAFGCKLHEFRLRVDTNGILFITVSSDGKTGTAKWDEVPAADRPKSCGCQYYINCVNNQDATCPFYTPVDCLAPSKG